MQAGMLAAERHAFTKALQNLRAAQALDPLDRDVRAAIVPYLEVYASAPRRRPWQAPLDVGRLAVSQAVEAARVALAARSGRG